MKINYYIQLMLFTILLHISSFGFAYLDLDIPLDIEKIKKEVSEIVKSENLELKLIDLGKVKSNVFNRKIHKVWKYFIDIELIIKKPVHGKTCSVDGILNKIKNETGFKDILEVLPISDSREAVKISLILDFEKISKDDNYLIKHSEKDIKQDSSEQFELSVGNIKKEVSKYINDKTSYKLDEIIVDHNILPASPENMYVYSVEIYFIDKELNKTKLEVLQKQLIQTLPFKEEILFPECTEYSGDNNKFRVSFMIQRDKSTDENVTQEEIDRKVNKYKLDLIYAKSIAKENDRLCGSIVNGVIFDLNHIKLNFPLLFSSKAKELLVKSYDFFGLLYLKNNLYDYSLEAYNNALKIDPEYESSIFRRSLAYTQLYRFKDALSGYDKVISMDKELKEKAIRNKAGLLKYLEENKDLEDRSLLEK